MLHSSAEPLLRRPLAFRLGGVALLVGAFWPVWQWYIARITESPEGITALIALGAAAFVFRWLVVRRQHREHRKGPQSGAPSESRVMLVLTAVMLIYAVAFSLFPTAVRGSISVGVLSVYLCAAFLGRWTQPGFCALLVLSLPIVPALEFHAGYIMRVITAEGAEWLWAPTGSGIQRVGASLNVGGRIVWVDEACAGVKMLWTGGFLMALCSIDENFGWGRFAAFAATTFVIVMFTNAFRAASLVPLEMNGGNETAHAIIGGIAFSFGAIFIMIAGWLFSREGIKCVQRLLSRASWRH